MALRTDELIFDELSADPGSPGEGEMWFNTTSNELKAYIDGATRVVWPPAGGDITGTLPTHAATHITGGTDEIDGDQLDIDFTPSNYSPSTTPAEATSVDHLTAHLAGIDDSLVLVSASSDGLQPQSNLAAAVNPTATDDSGSGYKVGSVWVNTSTDESFVCVDATSTAAVWKSTSSAAASVLAHKAGHVLAAAFTGKLATVTFGTAFGDADYAVTATAVTTSGNSYNISVSSQVAGSFDLDKGSTSIVGLTQVNWMAIKDGESA